MGFNKSLTPLSVDHSPPIEWEPLSTQSQEVLVNLGEVEEKKKKIACPSYVVRRS